MKKEYSTPEIDVISIYAKDVFTDSASDGSIDLEDDFI